MRGLTCLPHPRRFRLAAVAPPSKAHTLRAIFLAALSPGHSVLHRPLLGDDQWAALAAVARLGAAYTVYPDRLEIEGGGIREGGSPAVLEAGESGLTARVLLALAGLRPGGALIDGGSRLRAGRPVGDLENALRAMGWRLTCLGREGHLPIRVEPPPPTQVGSAVRRVPLTSPDSSQPLTALLLAAPLLPGGLDVELASPLPSRPYVEITLDLMRAFGAEPEVDENRFHVPPGMYRPRELDIEGDWSAAAFFFAAAALTGGSVTVAGLTPGSRQGDRAMADWLSAMGCDVSAGPDGVTVRGRPGRDLDVDASDSPDLVPAIAVVMGRTPGRHRIRGAAHLRIKESDRLNALAMNLNELGAEATETTDGIEIYGREEYAPNRIIRTFGDHRIAMAFAVAGLATPGLVVDDPTCVTKSFPDFWAVFETAQPAS